MESRRSPDWNPAVGSEVDGREGGIVELQYSSEKEKKCCKVAQMLI